jgi:hypothetical protein
MLIDFAKIIRVNHDKPWQKYFELEDMRVLTEMVIPLAWYPLRVFRKAGLAVFEVFGKNDPESAREWGRDMVRRMPEEIMSSFFLKSDPARAIRNWVNVNRTTFSFLRPKFMELGPKKIKVSFQGESEVKKVFPEISLLWLIMAGAIEEIAGRNGAVNASVKLDAGVTGDELIALDVGWT